MSKPVFRHEEKYLMSQVGYEQLRLLLGATMKRDGHAGADGDYFIRSLYFDTLGNRAYSEKEAGLHERMKIRLRLYDMDAGKVNLEIKNKSGNGIYKEMTLLSREDAGALIAGDYSVLLNYRDETAGKVYRCLATAAYRPAVMIDYEREAYTLPVFSTRITFDKEIRAHLGGNGFFDKNLQMSRLSCTPKVVLEVKYTGFLPKYIRDVLGAVPKNAMALSKYCMSRKLVG